MSIRLIPKYIIGKNEEDAQTLMYFYQVKNKKQCNVINIYERKNGEVVIWFYDEISNEEIIEKAKNQNGDVP